MSNFFLISEDNLVIYVYTNYLLKYPALLSLSNKYFFFYWLIPIFFFFWPFILASSIFEVHSLGIFSFVKKSHPYIKHYKKTRVTLNLI